MTDAEVVPGLAVDTPLTIGHVNDIASVGSTLVAAQRRRGDTVALIDIPKPGASLTYPWKIGSVALRLPILLGIAISIRRSEFAIAHIHYATQSILGPHVAVKPSEPRSGHPSEQRRDKTRALDGPIQPPAASPP